MQKPVLVLLLFVFVLASCTASPGEDEALGTSVVPTTSLPATSAVNAEDEAATTTSVEPATSSTTVAEIAATTAMDPNLEAAIVDLITITEELRQLTFEHPPIITPVTTEELAERVRDIIDEELDPDETMRDQALLASLGVIDAGTDLRDMYVDLYAEQVQGFYDGDTGELVVPVTGSGLDVLQKMVLVHELVHAVTDQNFGFHDQLEALIEADDYESSAALRALVEGDATYTQALYFWQLSKAEQTEGFELIDAGVSDAIAATPSYIVDLLQFPYNDGARFATTLGSRGGFAAIDAAYANPPTTTEQISDLSCFDAGEEAIDVGLADLELDGYELSEQGVWGQAGLRALFEQSLDRAAIAAAEGWGGDEYHFYWDGVDAVFVIEMVGDTPTDTEEMAAAWSDFFDAQVPESTARVIGWNGEDHLVIVASRDAAAVDAAADMFNVRLDR